MRKIGKLEKKKRKKRKRQKNKYLEGKKRRMKKNQIQVYNFESFAFADLRDFFNPRTPPIEQACVWSESSVFC